MIKGDLIMNEDNMNNINEHTNQETFQTNESPITVIYQILKKWFNGKSHKTQKRLIITFIIVAYLLGIGSHMLVGVKRSKYKALLADNSILNDKIAKSNNSYKALQDEYNTYKSKMQPYETQQIADVKATEEKKAAEEKAAKEEAERIAAEKAAKEAEERSRVTPSPTISSSNNYDSSTSTKAKSGNGQIKRNTNLPSGIPGFVEIITYCETAFPDFIGYNSDISLFDDYTKVVKTNLRNKLETTRLKIKPAGTYHKALMIIEFTDDTYQNYNVVSVEVDGIKYK